MENADPNADEQNSLLTVRIKVRNVLEIVCRQKGRMNDHKKETSADSAEYVGTAK